MSYIDEVRDKKRADYTKLSELIEMLVKVETTKHRKESFFYRHGGVIFVAAINVIGNLTAVLLRIFLTWIRKMKHKDMIYN